MNVIGEKQSQKIKEKRVRSICLQLLLSIDFIHRKNIIHRDLKPDNVLIDSDTKEIDIRIADFGFALYYQ